MNDAQLRYLKTLIDGASPKNPLSIRTIQKIKKVQQRANDLGKEINETKRHLREVESELLREEGAVRNYIEDLLELEAEADSHVVTGKTGPETNGKTDMEILAGPDTPERQALERQAS